MAVPQIQFLQNWGGSAISVGTVGSLFPAVDAEVLVSVLKHELPEVRKAVSHFAVDVDPLVAVFAENPLLTVNVGVVIRLHVDLPAEVAVLVVLVRRGAHAAQPEELPLAQLPPRPTPVLVPEPLHPAKPVSASSQSPLGNYLFI